MGTVSVWQVAVSLMATKQVVSNIHQDGYNKKDGHQQVLVMMGRNENPYLPWVGI